ncbi:hypothetical protein HYN59_17860 [Flavobacterium album]|uniref:Uncharacterized protein n=1 Tax=Flavobacterium album TaxID=2175091 RepID=A0A2S1R2R0_9FLAO|nr:hypothetical protein [Flavobacterium album]AWH86859.1 hypothetical protein HYN59_17860 [Flavobacterium album]
MKKTLLLIVLALLSLPLFSQTKEEEQVLAEAWLLYNSERASWLGTDLFLEKFPEKKENIGGYFSYSADGKHTCIFFDREQEPNVLGALTFDDSFVAEAADVNTTSRKLTPNEKDLYTIRQKAREESVNDTILFKHYNNTSLNFIPVILKNTKKVYVLTGPSVGGVVVFGNDYLIEFDKKNNIKSKKALHKNIIPIEYNSKQEEEITTMHNHQESTGDLITATDICTLMLYGPYANWKQHYVISKNNVSIWDCDKNQLFVMTRKAWDKIAKAEGIKD